MAAVASSLLTPLFTNRSTRLEVLGRTSELIWLAQDRTAFTVETGAPGRLSLPTSIFLPAALPNPEDFSLVEGQLAISGFPVQISRWWSAPRARVTSWEGPFGPSPKIEALMGRGEGLTPEGDDVIAGWLIMARAIQHPEFEEICDRVRQLSSARTTSFSAALLDCAASGYGVAPLVDYVQSHLTFSGEVRPARIRLLEVGHTSGRALALGVDMAVGLREFTFNNLKRVNTP